MFNSGKPEWEGNCWKRLCPCKAKENSQKAHVPAEGSGSLRDTVISRANPGEKSLFHLRAMWAGIFPPGPGERDSGGLEQVLWIAQAEEALQRLALVGQYGGILAQRRKEEAEKLWESGVRKEEITAPK